MKRLTPKQKAHIALAALKGEKISKLSSDYQIHANQINCWKKTAEEEIESLFADRRRKENKSKDRMINELYKTIGQREVEISWLKKNSGLKYQDRLNLINKGHQEISNVRQAELLSISRSSLYYKPTVNPEEIRAMNAIDEIFTERPFYGHRRIRDDLEDYDIHIGKKRTLSLKNALSNEENGLTSLLPQKKL